MKTKVLGLVLLSAALLAVGVIRTASKSQQSRGERPVESEKLGTFREQLERTKARGGKRLIRSGGAYIPIYAYASLDDALSIYDLVIAEPVFQKSFNVDNDGFIATWSKFNVIEVLSRAKTPRSLEDYNAPEELLPLGDNEILVWKAGGTAEVDGVEVVLEESGFPRFKNSQRYLLFLNLDPVKRVGWVEVGPSGVLVINADDTMEPINRDHRYYQTQIEYRFGNSLSKLKAKLN